ncbi:unnamed protein product, partial [Symbiodinium sp. KB8]
MPAGVGVEQDHRYSNKQLKLQRGIKAPAVYKVKVDTRKVHKGVIGKWVAERLTGMLGFEDEVVIGLVNNTLDSDTNPNPRELQVNLTGFLEKKAQEFVTELWELLTTAQETPSGIPAKLLEQRKAAISARQAADSASITAAAAGAMSQGPGAVAAALQRHAATAQQGPGTHSADARRSRHHQVAGGGPRDTVGRQGVDDGGASRPPRRWEEQHRWQ